MSRRYLGRCSAGTKAGDLGGVLGLRTEEGRRAMSRRYLGRCSAGTKAGDLGGVLGLRTEEGRRAMSRRYLGPWCVDTTNATRDSEHKYFTISTCFYDNEGLY